MPPSLRRLTRRLGAAGPGFVDAFLRDSRVLPPVLALLALLVFAWVVAGTLVGGSLSDRLDPRTATLISMLGSSMLIVTSSNARLRYMR